jgi:hypothetical protein
MSARIFQFTSSALRTSRPRAVYYARLPCRNLWGFGPKQPEPPASSTPAVDEEELAKTKKLVENMFKDKPEAVNAVVKFAKIMEESGLRLTTE